MKVPNSAWYSTQGHLTLSLVQLSYCSYPEGLREHCCHPANLSTMKPRGHVFRSPDVAVNKSMLLWQLWLLT